MSNTNERVQPTPPPAQPSFADRVRAKIAALKARGPRPGDLGDGAAERAGRHLAERRRRIDQAIDEATR